VDDKEKRVSISLSKNDTDNDADVLFALQQFIDGYRELATSAPSVPIGIFGNPELGILQALTIYLHEIRNQSFHEIARLLDRNDRTIWASYHQGKEQGLTQPNANNQLQVPVALFSNRKVGPLQALVYYLRSERKLTRAQIAGLLSRSYTTIYLTEKNAIKRGAAHGN
jgi:hypothetical protein